MYAKGGIILVVLLIIQLQLSSSSYLKQLFALRTRKDARSFHGLVDSFSSRIEGTRTKRPENILNRKLVMLRGGFSLDSLNPGLSPSLHQSKILLQIALTMFNIICWVLPLRMKSFTQNSAVLSYANVFAGGIFLMLSFEHLLPEAVRSMAAGVSGEGSHAIVYALVGYMAMLLIEKVVFVTHITPEDVALVDAGYTSHSSTHRNSQDTHGFSIASNNCRNRQNSAIALCCAMSVHSFFEAAALGLATDFTAACMMSACIALHQPAESVALLVAFLKSGMSQRNTVLWLTGFSLVSLGGVLAGLLVTSMASVTMESVVMAITAGTFIYVGATEIANEEFEGDLSAAQRAGRYLCYAAGMGTMYSISALSRHYSSSSL